MTEDQDAQTETNVKRLRSSTIVSASYLSCETKVLLWYEGLDLQDCNNKAPDTCSQTLCSRIIALEVD